MIRNLHLDSRRTSQTFVAAAIPADHQAPGGRSRGVRRPEESAGERRANRADARGKDAANGECGTDRGFLKISCALL